MEGWSAVVSYFCEVGIMAEEEQKLKEMVITEAMKNRLKKGKAIIFVDTEENVIKKNDDLIITHKWRIFNKN